MMFLLIDNYDSFTYNIQQCIRAHGAEVEVFRNDQISLDEIENMSLDGIIISPGPGKPSDAGLCISIIKVFSGRIPILGICLGHQAIAEVFGGEVTLAHEVVHGKETFIFHPQKGLYQGMPLPFKAGRYHSLIVDHKNLGPLMKAEAENEEGLLMGVRHTFHETYGVQFHPESILTPSGPLLFKNFIDICTKLSRKEVKVA
jgi:anthranilate synthase component 2